MKKYFITFAIFCFIFVSFVSASEKVVSERDQLILNIIKRHDDEIDRANGLPWGYHNAAKGYHSNFDRGTRVHPTRAAMERAVYLLASPYADHHAEGNKVLAKILSFQDCNPQSVTFGLWSWYIEEPLSDMARVDFNWADFQGAVLIIILHDFDNRLQADVLAKAKKSLEYCCRAIIKRNVGPSYTNIAITGATVTAVAGEILRNDEFLDFGRRRILRSLMHFRENGSFNEYNSPAYLPVVIEELERMLYLASDMDCRNAAKELLANTWKMIALRYHVPTGELAGPHSRSYADRLPEKTRNMILARLDGINNKPAQNAVEASVLTPMRRIDDSLKKYFTEIPDKPREVKNLFVKNRVAFDVTGTTWMDAKSTIGTASYHTFWEQSRGLIGYWIIDNNNDDNNVNNNDDNNDDNNANDVKHKNNTGDNNYRNVNLRVKKSTNETVAVLRLRFKHDGNDFASAWGRHYQTDNKIITAIGLLNNQGSMHTSMDRPVDGIFRAKSFEVEYHLDGFGATVRQLDDNKYELSAGLVRIIIHTTPESQFDGKQITWKMKSNLTSATLTGECYNGAEREFVLAKLKNTKIAVGLELLNDKKTKPINSKIKITESNFKTKREGNFYAVVWKNINDKNPLLAPIKPIQK
ncbi:MAG: hypothetical protein LBP59_14345 [Planctomycetaceae bacterium]|jgi:hypothetical protein|nr:hypothetical protein [Planctomycetaceae bacterium]